MHCTVEGLVALISMYDTCESIKSSFPKKTQKNPTTKNLIEMYKFENTVKGSFTL